MNVSYVNCVRFVCAARSIHIACSAVVPGSHMEIGHDRQTSSYSFQMFAMNLDCFCCCDCHVEILFVSQINPLVWLRSRPGRRNEIFIVLRDLNVDDM